MRHNARAQGFPASRAMNRAAKVWGAYVELASLLANAIYLTSSASEARTEDKNSGSSSEAFRRGACMLRGMRISNMHRPASLHTCVRACACVCVCVSV